MLRLALDVGGMLARCNTGTILLLDKNFLATRGGRSMNTAQY